MEIFIRFVAVAVRLGQGPGDTAWPRSYDGVRGKTVRAKSDE